MAMTSAWAPVTRALIAGPEATVPAAWPVAAGCAAAGCAVAGWDAAGWDALAGRPFCGRLAAGSAAAGCAGASLFAGGAGRDGAAFWGPGLAGMSSGEGPGWVLPGGWSAGPEAACALGGTGLVCSVIGVASLSRVCGG
jgi:hypothetical protein